ncbi:hypothetical protein [Gimesia maris]|uniref:hypothetical protein n=1 Tax=Gimesia maris TaxID=122 RepID=UPI0012B9AF9F|nr:hypothetical protein [Gimesia maris]
MMRLVDHPQNKPVVKQIQDVDSYHVILRQGAKYARYLLGEPDDDMRDYYTEGMWVPMMSKVRYALMCLGINNPENEEPYHRFCEIHMTRGESCSLTDYRGNVVLRECIHQLELEIKTQQDK